MQLLNLVSTLFQPAADLIDNMHTSTEEKLVQKTELVKVQAAILDAALEYEKSNFETKSAIVLAEAKSDHWVTATWRPIVMLVFCGLVVADSFGLVEYASGSKMAEEMWTLLQIGLGGYVVGRSAEKVASTVMNNKK